MRDPTYSDCPEARDLASTGCTWIVCEVDWAESAGKALLACMECMGQHGAAMHAVGRSRGRAAPAARVQRVGILVSKRQEAGGALNCRAGHQGTWARCQLTGTLCQSPGVVDWTPLPHDCQAQMGSTAACWSITGAGNGSWQARQVWNLLGRDMYESNLQHDTLQRL